MILFNLADEGVQLLRRGCTVSSDGTVQFTPSLLFIQNGRGVQFGATYSPKFSKRIITTKDIQNIIICCSLTEEVN